jgi:hypothetical protein
LCVLSKGEILRVFLHHPPPPILLSKHGIPIHKENPSKKNHTCLDSNSFSQSVLHYILLLKTFVVIRLKIRQILDAQGPLSHGKRKELL